MSQWNAQDYAKSSSVQAIWAQELIAKLNIRGNEAVFDVGCGDGKMTAEIAKRLPNGFVLGIDSSSEMVEFAISEHLQPAIANLQFACMDAREIVSDSFPERLRDRPFDIVFSNAVLHWVNDHPAFLRGASRVLRSGGRLLTSCGGKGNAADIVSVFQALIQQSSWQPYFTNFQFPYFFYSPHEYADWLAESGFQPVRVDLVPKDMIHTGKEGLAGWIRTTWMPYIHRVPESRREELIEEFLQKYLNQHPLDCQGNSHVKMVRLEVEAIKI
ncbi:methyltransferase domain-containing protein [Phormidium sp. CLA17]|uniref:class I SAM-dependent methyltransferase n=1 Tax=Leptolyngbya sp. Cla-17 TaxID=2803751 RepID=UPI001492DB61|nr:class I SAM-dependent methyltransferase [Leptolyngbya sp. Cla-17]MBM0742908.1 methyltransferase domain-containing protein [Leptolyngbya sp. Cla-17]